jgi:hypothetical protein
MAINFIYGLGGSGKTYFAVTHLLQQYYDYDKATDHYYLKPSNQDLKIITNIDQFALDHIKLDDWIKHAGSIEKFFHYDTQLKIFEKHGPVVYMIDEAHEYFPDYYKDQGTLNWLSYHRHWGQTIYLMSQAHSRLPRKITDLVELQIYAMPPSSSLLGGRDLKYNIMSGREVVDRKAIIKNKRIFKLYKSQYAATKEKTKNPLLKYIIGCSLVAILLIGNAIRWASDFGQHEKTTESITKIDVNPLSIAPSTAESVPQSIKNEPKPTKKLIEVEPVGISYATFRGKTVLFHDDKIYDIKDFPYTVKTTSLNQMVALVPKSLTTPKKTNPPQVRPGRNSSASSPKPFSALSMLN